MMGLVSLDRYVAIPALLNSAKQDACGRRQTKFRLFANKTDVLLLLKTRHKIGWVSSQISS